MESTKRSSRRYICLYVVGFCVMLIAYTTTYVYFLVQIFIGRENENVAWDNFRTLKMICFSVHILHYIYSAEMESFSWKRNHVVEVWISFVLSQMYYIDFLIDLITKWNYACVFKQVKHWWRVVYLALIPDLIYIVQKVKIIPRWLFHTYQSPVTFQSLKYINKLIWKPPLYFI